MKALFKKFRQILISILIAGGLLTLAGSDKSGLPDKQPTDKDKTENTIPVLPLFNPQDSFRYVARTLPNWALPKNSFTAKTPEDSISPEDKNLWQNLQTMKNSKTIIAPQLFDFSRRADIIYSRDTLKGMHGGWTDRNGIISINSNPRLSDNFLLVVQSHEVIHGIQRVTSTEDEKAGWSIFERQSSDLSYEAAAMVGCHLVALEMREKGDPACWLEVEKHYPAMASDMLEHWNKVRHEKIPFSKKLEKTGTLSFYSIFKQQGWLDFYNGAALEAYVFQTLNSSLPEMTQERYSLKTLQKSGYISPQFNFTAKADYIPGKDVKFGNNTTMRQAFEYAELERVAQACGREDSHYRALLERAKKNENPYIGVSLEMAFLLQMVMQDSPSRFTLKDALDYLVSLKTQELKTPIPGTAYSR